MKHSGTVGIRAERLILRRFTTRDAEDAYENRASGPRIRHEYGEPVYESREAV